MVKKHMITCGLMLVILLTAKLFIFSSRINPIEVIKFNEQHPEKEIETVNYYQTLSFADENLPAQEVKVKWRMKKMLDSHKHSKLQTNKLHQKAAIWFPVMEPILKRYGIPADFKYMPLVESGLQAGTSPKGASGYWQFMPQTARDFGLRVNSEVDERQQVVKSTVAAAKYLRSLYKEFGSWTLAAAAYNIGEGSLKRQMARQDEDNYFRLKLNRETATYVYKLISMKEIIEKPRLYGYKGKASRKLEKKQPKTAYFKPVAQNTNMLAMQILQN
ncbi:lytic transglycosylase domain-containing protein [Daejeonella oryzae]|uniref:lytic transglycosylase domain-containing protein n=1 Tax=Daejeonella oryzae TaxID=1122943 RepID=UPI0009DB8007|nr:lytic transglycosylase domain-containing protein [Daejeonella oryzae]